MYKLYKYEERTNNVVKSKRPNWIMDSDRHMSKNIRQLNIFVREVELLGH